MDFIICFKFLQRSRIFIDGIFNIFLFTHPPEFIYFIIFIKYFTIFYHLHFFSLFFTLIQNSNFADFSIRLWLQFEIKRWQVELIHLRRTIIQITLLVIKRISQLSVRFFWKINNYIIPIILSLLIFIWVRI